MKRPRSLQPHPFRGLVIALSLTVAFLVGCLTATIGTQLVVPPVKAGTTPQKWEQRCESWGKHIDYRISNLNEKRGWNSILTKYGVEGWEAFSISIEQRNIMMVCFKRPLPN